MILNAIDVQLKESYTHYKNKYGKELVKVPKEIEESEVSFGPYEIVRNLQILGISSKEYYLFFFGKIY